MSAPLQPYASVHVWPTNGPGDARPTALQIVKDNDLEGKLSDKVALVTGASSGIGIPTALALAATGMRVFAAVRNLEKGRSALGEHLQDGKLELIHLDNNSLASVRKCAAEFLERSGGKLNILINNAGVMMTPEGRTEDGFETQFGVNYLSHFLLFQLLKPALLSSASPDFGSRVVNVSSTGHRYGEVNFENLNLEGGIYHPGAAYGQSKTALIYMANEIERRYGSRHLHAFSLDPGGIWTGLQIHVPEEMMKAWKESEDVKKHMKSVEQGAATQVWAALARDLEGKGGLYLENTGVGVPVSQGYQVAEPGYERYAFDEGKEGRLWGVACGLVGVSSED